MSDHKPRYRPALPIVLAAAAVWFVLAALYALTR